MKRTFGLAAALGLLVGAIQTHGQSFTFDFEDGTDQGFGTGFGNDASATFPIVNISGSFRMGLTLGGFQVAGREGTSGGYLAAMNAAAANPSGYTISYDWYVDTSLSPGLNGTFLQLGTYLNSGSGAYSQDFPGAGKDVELNGTQLASGNVFFGTVTETLTAKFGSPLNAGHVGQTFQRLGIIMNGDGTASPLVYYDNITISLVPEPTSLALLGLAVPAWWMIRRRRSTNS